MAGGGGEKKDSAVSKRAERPEPRETVNKNNNILKSVGTKNIKWYGTQHN
jgi:hypothetical protein